MNRYQLNHRSDTESTMQIASYSHALSSVCELLTKVNDAYKICLIKKTYEIVDQNNMPCALGIDPDTMNFVIVIILKKKNQIPFTLSMPLEAVILMSVEEIAKRIDEQVMKGEKNLKLHDKAIADKKSKATIFDDDDDWLQS